MHDNGLDEYGYIINHCSTDKLQAAYRPLVEQTCSALLSTFPSKLHSIYLYGSVARGEAILDKSDLDVSVVFEAPPTNADRHALNELSHALCARFPIISKLDFDPGHLAEVKAPNEAYNWQFWLKHCCCCIWGEDLAPGFRRHRPSLRIAQSINSDLPSRLERVKANLNADNAAMEGQSITKKLIRTAYSLVAERDNSWHQDLATCVDRVICHEPGQIQGISQALALAQSDRVSIEAVHALLDGYGQWLARRLVS